MSDKKKKKEKKGKVKAKLKNIAKGKISTKMFRGGSRSKVSAPTSRSVSSFTPGTKQEIDKKETGMFNDDIKPYENDKKWLEGFKTAYDKSGGREFKYQGKRWNGGDRRLGDMVSNMISKLSGPQADSVFTDYTKAFMDWARPRLGSKWTMIENEYKKNPNGMFGTVAINVINDQLGPYKKATGEEGLVSKAGGGNQGGYSSAFKSWVQNNFSKQIQSGTSIDQLMGDSKVQGTYTQQTGNKP